jgi:hypothetical protein
VCLYAWSWTVSHSYCQRICRYKETGKLKPTHCVEK